MKSSVTFLFAALLLLDAGTASAMLEAWIDVSDLGVTEIELEVALYNNSGLVGDSWAFVDDIAISSPQGDLSDQPAFSTAAAVAGSLENVGVGATQINEQQDVNPTMLRWQYPVAAGDMLTFEFGMQASETAGSWGLDELVFSLLDPSTGAPLGTGLTEGMADVLAVTAEGVRHTNRVAVIPEPATLLFALFGIPLLRGRRGSRLGV